MTARRAGNFMAMINTLNRRVLGVIFLLTLTKAFSFGLNLWSSTFLFEPTPPNWCSVFFQALVLERPRCGRDSCLRGGSVCPGV